MLPRKGPTTVIDEARQAFVTETRRLNFLLLCEFHDGTAATIIDHINALAAFSRHKVRVVSMMGRPPHGIDFDRFDGIIIHYSLIACHNSYIHPSVRRRIGRFRGIKLAYVQDDYRFINDTCAALRFMGINVLFGLAPKTSLTWCIRQRHFPMYGARRSWLVMSLRT